MCFNNTFNDDCDKSENLFRASKKNNIYFINSDIASTLMHRSCT